MLYLLFAIQSLPQDPLYGIPISHEHPDIPIDVGFCGGNDHLQIGIGGNRFGMSLLGELESDGLSNGIYAKFELWAPEDAILRIFNHCLGTDLERNETLVQLIIVGRDEQGWTDAVLNALRTEPEFMARMKDILLKQVRLFRENELVARQTAHYREARTGTGSAG